jgi:hypothetical protein
MRETLSEQRLPQNPQVCARTRVHTHPHVPHVQETPPAHSLSSEQPMVRVSVPSFPSSVPFQLLPQGLDPAPATAGVDGDCPSPEQGPTTHLELWLLPCASESSLLPLA